MILAALLLAQAAAPLSETDLQGHVAAGDMLCSNPDSATMTCSAIDSFSSGIGDTLTNTGEILLVPGQTATLRVTSIMHIEGDAFCGVMNAEDMEKAQVSVGGVPLSPAQNSKVLSGIIERLKPMVGHKVCETVRLEDGRLMKYGKIEGIDVTPPGKPVSWIVAADGYRVAPH